MTMTFCRLIVALDSSVENDEIFMIHSEGKEVKLTEEINIEVEPKPMFCMDNYKDALLVNLISSKMNWKKKPTDTHIIYQRVGCV